jgi:hypothetical protein
MSSQSGEGSREDSRLDEILAKYWQAVEAGEAPDREQMIREHAEHSDELRMFLADKNKIDEIATPDTEAVALPRHAVDNYLESPTIPPDRSSTLDTDAATIPPRSDAWNATNSPAKSDGDVLRFFWRL